MTTITNDTICAISTAPGVGGIAVTRVSGPDAIAIVSHSWTGADLTTAKPRTVHYGTITDIDGTPLDQVVVTIFRAPHSFTGEDTVEISTHGSKYIQRRLLGILTANGCRLAGPGEFTRRAFTSGKLDLVQAEAVADMIASNSRASHRIAISQMTGGISQRLADLRQQLIELASLLELELDFSEEDVEFASREKLKKISTEVSDEINRLAATFTAGNAIKEGIPVAIVGATNAGKSSLLNTLLADERSIVSDIHGTTRDTVEETATIGDYLFRFIDTAGLRHTTDAIEQLGIQRSRQAIAKANIIINVIDSTLTTPPPPIDIPSGAILITAKSKADLLNENVTTDTGITTVSISAKTGQGIDTLRQALTDAADRLTGQGTGSEDIIITNERHVQALTSASQAISRVIDGLNTNLPGDLIAQDLRETLHHLASITGQITTPDILSSIFTRFCIGK